MSIPSNPYAHVYASFADQTSAHQLTVLHDDGLYRHLRMRALGQGNVCGWDITTWPGHLATSGDIAGGFVFSRIEDMLQFFDCSNRANYYSDGSPSIDFRYWAEKLVGTDNYNRVRSYSRDLFLRQVREDLEEDDELGTEAQAEHEKRLEVAQRVCTRAEVDLDDYLALLRRGDDHAHLGLEIDESSADECEYFGQDIPVFSPADFRQDLLAAAAEVDEDATSAHEWLRDHDDVFGTDTWEWELSDFNIHFLFACYALELTARLWREHINTTTPEGKSRA